jgi:DNA-binding NarL/FixJ family response regulator
MASIPKTDCRHGYPWVPEEEEFLLNAWKQGWRHKAIARELQRTPHAISERLYLLKDHLA